MSTAETAAAMERKSVGAPPSPRASQHDQGSLGDDRDEFTAWLAASCQRQNVPLSITDPTVIARVGTLLGHPPPRPA